MSKQYTRLRPHWRPTHETNPTGFDQWIAPDGANGWVKILNPDGHHVRRVWEVAPEAKILLRNHSISEQKAELLADPVGLARQHVDFWIKFVHQQGLAGSTSRLAFEGINEAAIWEPGVLDALVTYTVEVLRYAFGSDSLKGRMGVLQMNTGWPTNHGVKDAPPDWGPFEPVRVALKQYGGYLCLHEYFDHRGPNSTDWGWNPGRFTQLPDSWRGIPILITECGYDAAVNAPSGTNNHGYIGKMSPEQYVTHLEEYDISVRTSGWDVQACFIFTHDWDQPWGTFDTRPIMSNLITWAQQQRAIDIPTTPPPPGGQETTPDPGGDGEEAKNHVQLLVNGRVVWSEWLD